MSHAINNSIRSAAITLGIDENVLAKALPTLREGGFDPLLGHEYAYNGSKLSDYIGEQYRIIRDLRAENLEMKLELRKLKEPKYSGETVTIPAIVWKDILIKSENPNG